MVQACQVAPGPDGPPIEVPGVASLWKTSFIQLYQRISHVRGLVGKVSCGLLLDPQNMAAEVLPLHRLTRPATRPGRGVAELRAELAAMRDRLNLLLVQLEHGQDDEADAAHGVPPRQGGTVALVIEGPIVCRKQAAAAIGWREDRLTATIIRHNASNPDDPIGWQAGGNRRARWEIPLGRLLRFVQNRPAAGNTAKPGKTR